MTEKKLFQTEHSTIWVASYRRNKFVAFIFFVAETKAPCGKISKQTLQHSFSVNWARNLCFSFTTWQVQIANEEIHDIDFISFGQPFFFAFFTCIHFQPCQPSLNKKKLFHPFHQSCVFVFFFLFILYVCL